jgi:hypothetical protein
MSLRDGGLDRLLDLDGFLTEIGAGYWVKILAEHTQAATASSSPGP